MSKRDHYTAEDIIKSSRTRRIDSNAGAILFSHTIPNVAYSYIIVDINPDGTHTKWEAFESVQRVKREMERAAARAI